MRQPVTLRSVISLLGIATLVLAGSFAIADITPPPPPPPSGQCDFLTGGGFIFPTIDKGTFAIGGGCRHGSGINGAPYWGHKFGDVNFAVRVSDAGEPGTADEFDIQLTQNGVIVYTTFIGAHHKLGGGTGGGGNIQLHKPNDSTTGVFGGSCPAAI